MPPLRQQLWQPDQPPVRRRSPLRLHVVVVFQGLLPAASAWADHNMAGTAMTMMTMIASVGPVPLVLNVQQAVSPVRRVSWAWVDMQHR